MDMVLTARMMDAAEAERSSLVSRVVPLAELVPNALETAKKIASLSPLAVMMAKETVNAAYETQLAEGREAGAAPVPLAVRLRRPEGRHGGLHREAAGGVQGALDDGLRFTSPSWASGPWALAWQPTWSSPCRVAPVLAQKAPDEFVKWWGEFDRRRAETEPGGAVGAECHWYAPQVSDTRELLAVEEHEQSGDAVGQLEAVVVQEKPCRLKAGLVIGARPISARHARQTERFAHLLSGRPVQKVAHLKSAGRTCDYPVVEVALGQ